LVQELVLSRVLSRELSTEVWTEPSTAVLEKWHDCLEPPS
jgi:hypothetical protein